MPRIVRRQGANPDALPADLSPVLRRVYANRGIQSAEELALDLKGLLPYAGLKGIQTASNLLAEAVQTQRHILIVGDYDADGATATALAVLGLQRLGAQRVSYLIPDRARHGYGLTPTIVELARAEQPDLLLTVDNGISSIDGVAAARAAGMTVVVTDHHLPGETLPEADAIVNPNQPGCAFESKQLAGVGVMFYVLAGLRAELEARGQWHGDKAPSMAALLDLVALGTVADLVRLDRNNRILVRQGLRRMQAGRTRPGILALARVAGRRPEALEAVDIGFALAPRLNAAGRMENMGIGVECLLAEDESRAQRIAETLDGLNRDRRKRQALMQEDAEASLADLVETPGEQLPNGLCVHDAGWHEGIVGLVAGKLKERFHRPAIAFAPSGRTGVLKGSARSIPGVHIRDVLAGLATTHPGLIERFGGHAMAAGLSLRKSRLADFRTAFEQELARWVTRDLLDQTIKSDGELSSAELTLDTAVGLAQAGPWGQGFSEPLFDGRFEVLEQRIVGDAHLKLRLCPSAGGPVIEAIRFRHSDLLPARVPLTFAYKPQVNEFRGITSLQLLIEHVDGAD